jgi:hypothetical protein
MSRLTTSLLPPSRLRIICSAAGLNALVNIWRGLRREIFDSYRPELHYMRGPGPRWREKHAHIAEVSSISHQQQTCRSTGRGGLMHGLTVEAAVTIVRPGSSWA